MKNDIIQINRSINNIMGKYLSENGYQHSVVFESKTMLMSNSVMFCMNMKQGLTSFEPFKAVFPEMFLEMSNEDDIVKMICDLFKNVLLQCDKINENALDDADQEESSAVSPVYKRSL